MVELGDLTDEQVAVVEATVRCFERFGPQRTSMSDIADEAGISRRTLYRLFEDRSSLVQQLVFQRLSALVDTVRRHLAGYTDIEAALIDGSLHSVEVGESDAMFVDVVRHEHDRSLERFLAADPALRSSLVQVWEPTLSAGRAAGRVRHDLSDERVVELIMTVQSIVLGRDDLDRPGRRALLRDLLVPAVLADVGQPDSPESHPTTQDDR